MTDPIRASERPYPTDVTKGEIYYWCACGRSANQPFCDGSHKGTGITPVKFEAKKSGKVFFCGCKATGDRPLCDGTHNR